MDLQCEHCCRAYPAEVQFKTDADYCEIYKTGDRLDDLPAGGEWEGIADRYCRECDDGHRAERERAMAAIVSAQVQAGDVTIGRGDGGSPLTAKEIQARGEEAAEAVRGTRTHYGITMLLTDLYWRDRYGAWLPIRDWFRGDWPQTHERLTEEMRRRGWPAGDGCFRKDLVVRLDEERRIWVDVVKTG